MVVVLVSIWLSMSGTLCIMVHKEQLPLSRSDKFLMMLGTLGWPIMVLLSLIEMWKEYRNEQRQ